METDPLKILQKTHAVNFNREHMAAAQAQQHSPLKEKGNLENIKNAADVKRKIFFIQKPQTDTLQRQNYIPSLCVSQKEYETIVNKSPLIKFRPLVNTFIKSSDKALLAESLNVPKNQVDRVINETIQYLLYQNPASIYYNPNVVFEDLYLDEDFKRRMAEQNITDERDRQMQELLYYQEHSSVMEPYIYRHGSKEQLINYMKLQLSDAKSALKQLYNILDNECGGLYSYFERPIHVLDNRSVIKMHNIIKDGLGEAHKQGYITQDCYDRNVQWALEKIYEIQSNTSLREALRIVKEHS